VATSRGRTPLNVPIAEDLPGRWARSSSVSATTASCVTSLRVRRRPPARTGWCPASTPPGDARARSW